MKLPTRWNAASITACAACALACWPPSVALASQIIGKKITLKKLVARAQVIVVARADTPFTRDVSIAHHRGRGQKKKCPAFRKHLRRFVVLETLKNTSGQKLPKKIEVAAANWRLYKGMSNAYCLGQPVPSPIVSSYAPALELAVLAKDAKKKALLFLVSDGKGQYRFATMSSHEAVAKTGKVRALLNASPPAPKPAR